LKLIFSFLTVCSLVYGVEYKLRKYTNVKEFYQPITKDIIELSLKYNTPPAAILAIAGLESGYGSGYVAQITGNILSLGAGKSEKELPALHLPYCKTDKHKKTLFDPQEQKKCQDLIWKKRPKSLKKDYRPKHLAGTIKNLEFFKYNPQAYQKAKLQNIKDFLSKWINKEHKYKPFYESKLWLESKVKKNGENTLFDLDTNIAFINKIGGKKNSFNYRKSWVKKVIYILKNTGLNELSKKIYFQQKSFQKAWGKS
jgi:hypothetical protein